MSHYAHTIDPMAQQPAPAAPSTRGGVSEIVLVNDHLDCNQMILPMLAHLSKQREAGGTQRWFTWIAPRKVNKALLAEFGFELDRVRLIHTRSDDESLWVMWEALHSGTSATVVAHLSNSNEKVREKLEDAAHQGNARALLLATR